MSPDFWRGRRVFLTGHTGFKGSWLSLWLQTLGAELTGFALNPPTSSNIFDIAGVASGMKDLRGDIRDYRLLKEALQESQPEVVIHMAAQPLVKRSYDDPIETYSTNVMGTVNLLEAARSTPAIKAILNVTTDKCYENREWVWGYRENESLGGYDPYSNSKACSELVTASYRHSFFNQDRWEHHRLALASARAGNVIGGGDWALNRLIPDIIRAYEAGAAVSIRNPGAIRPWQHVLEPLRGYLMITEKLITDGSTFAEPWNFGPLDEDVKSVEWIVDRISRMWGPEAKWIIDQSEHPHEAIHLKLDVSKAKAKLGWRPVLRLEQGLEMIVNWHKAAIRGDDLRVITLDQIANYQRLTQK